MNRIHTDRKGNQSLRFSKIIALRSKVLCRETVFRSAGRREKRFFGSIRSVSSPDASALPASSGRGGAVARRSVGRRGGPVCPVRYSGGVADVPGRASGEETGERALRFRGGRAVVSGMLFATVRFRFPWGGRGLSAGRYIRTPSSSADPAGGDGRQMPGRYVSDRRFFRRSVSCALHSAAVPIRSARDPEKGAVALVYMCRTRAENPARVRHVWAEP